MHNSSQVKRIEFLDFAKGFAILTIVLFHYFKISATGLMSKAIMFGGTGVHLFIIMSGFGLTLSPFFSSLSFYKRRFLKILVPYYLFVTFLFILNQFYMLFPEDDLYAYLGHILWYKMFDESIISSFYYHLWFLSTIIQFYLIYPLLLEAKGRLGNMYFVILAISISVIYWFTIIKFNVSEMLVFRSFFLQYLWEFCIGMVLADQYRKRHYKFWQQRVSILFLVTIIGIALMGFMAMKGGYIGRVLNDIPAAFGYTSLVILTYLLFTKINNIFTKIFKYIGSISYELYLIHMFAAMVIVSILFNHTIYSLSYSEGLFIIPFTIALAMCYKMFSMWFVQFVSGIHKSLGRYSDNVLVGE